MWVVAALASLAVLIILVLCVPLDMAFRIDIYGRPKFSMKLVWFFGLVSKEITKAKKKPEEKKKVIEGKPKRRGRRVRPGTILEILRTKGLPRQLKGLLKDVLRRIRIRDLVANFRVGLDSPADTGFLFAIVGPITSLLKSISPQQIRLQPDFDEAVLEGDLSGAVRLQPIRLVIPLLRFVFSLPTMRALKTLVLTKWKRKK